MNSTKMTRILFLCALSVATVAVNAMEKEPKQLSKKQQALKLQREARENEILKKRSREIAEADEFVLPVERVKKPKYFVVADEENSNINFEDIIPEPIAPQNFFMNEEYDNDIVFDADISPSTKSSLQRPIGTPMPKKWASYKPYYTGPKRVLPKSEVQRRVTSVSGNPMKKVLLLNKAMNNKDQDIIDAMLDNSITVEQIKAFQPYSGAINKETKKLNRNMGIAQKWIAEREALEKQKAVKTRYVTSKPNTNTNG